jgi:hypothetical protein
MKYTITPPPAPTEANYAAASDMLASAYEQIEQARTILGVDRLKVSATSKRFNPSIFTIAWSNEFAAGDYDAPIGCDHCTSADAESLARITSGAWADLQAKVAKANEEAK